MTEYLIYFNQQWVGDHTEEWFRGARAARHGGRRRDEGCRGVRLRRRAGGDDRPVFSADATSGALIVTDGPYVETKEWLGGSPSSTWPTTRPPRCGPVRSRSPAAGPRRFARFNTAASVRVARTD